MTKAVASYRHWLWPMNWPNWPSPVCCLLLLLMIVGSGTLLPCPLEYMLPQAHSERQEGDDADETTTMVAYLVVVPRSSQRKRDVGRACSKVPLAVMRADSVLHFHLFNSFLPLAPFARQAGAGISMRC